MDGLPTRTGGPGIKDGEKLFANDRCCVAQPCDECSDVGYKTFRFAMPNGQKEGGCTFLRIKQVERLWENRSSCRRRGDLP